MPPPQTIPLLPCASIDEVEDFYAAVDFRTTYRQHRPYQSLALQGHGFDLQHRGLEGHTPEASHSSRIAIVDDTAQVWEPFAGALKGACGSLPMTGFPRITRPLPRKNADGLSGFSLIDPAGNWIRFFNRPGAAPSTPPRAKPTRENLLRKCRSEHSATVRITAMSQESHMRGRAATPLATLAIGITLMASAAGCALTGEGACAEFVGEVNPSAGGEPSPEDAIAAWAQDPPMYITADVDPTGWSQTSSGASTETFANGNSTLEVTRIDVSGSTEWFVTGGRVCP